MVGIRHMLLIDAPVQKVYKALTEQEGLSGWWTTDTVVEPLVGSTAEFKFGDRYRNKMRIRTLETDKTVEWDCLEGDDEWVGTRIRFVLEKQGDQTLLRFFHTDWREMTDFFAVCNYHWGFYMRSLKSFCETGRGEPFEGDPV